MKFITIALTDETAFCDARYMMSLMFRENVLPPARSELTGGETAIFALDDDIHAGMAIVYQPVEQEFLWLDLLYVKPEYRRRGIGTNLMAKAIDQAIAQKLPAIELGTFLTNDPMMNLARKFGYGEATVYWRRSLLGGSQVTSQ